MLAAVDLAQRRALANVPDRHSMTRAAAVVRYLHLHYAKPHQEILGASFPTTRNRLIGCREVYRGTLCRAAVEPREILRDGLLRAAGSARPGALRRGHPLQPGGWRRRESWSVSRCGTT